jgi:hypothetical protein
VVTIYPFDSNSLIRFFAINPFLPVTKTLFIKKIVGFKSQIKYLEGILNVDEDTNVDYIKGNF